MEKKDINKLDECLNATETYYISKETDKILTDEEVRLLIKNMPTKRLSLMSEIQYELALTSDEACRIADQNFDWKDWLIKPYLWGHLKVFSEGEVHRIIPVKPSLMKKIYEAIKSIDRLDSNGIPIPGVLFDFDFDKYMNSKRKQKRTYEQRFSDYMDYAENIYREAITKTGLRILCIRIVPGILRKTKAYNLQLKGMPFVSIQKLLGYSDSTSLDRLLNIKPNLEEDFKKYNPDEDKK